ncbi:MAG TPA: hypothetical protein VFY73_29460 [Ideonella sp.]|uniref:hypothetical protein n=1 Tax=Ideonella sp. TaxID=1929293 RepID=UPI002E2FDB90|nr:hypothetical protein [Ideonella sp.]HEX5688166.1 hypothetical protein [Ideonella sp.]
MTRRRPSRDAVDAFHFEQATCADLRERRWLRLHVLMIGGVSLALCWAVSRGLDAAGVDSLAWRPLLALWLSYPLYLGLMALWARWLLSREEGEVDDLLDAADGLADASGSVFRSGGGGDFGGGGASGDFGAAGDVVGGVGDALGAADEGLVIAVPLAIVVGVAMAIGAGLGLLVFGLFGVEVLLGVAVEIAFASVGGALAWRARREGWLAHALRRTFLPMLGLSAVTAAAGWALHHWLPQAHTVPQALRLLWS